VGYGCAYAVALKDVELHIYTFARMLKLADDGCKYLQRRYKELFNASALVVVFHS
jgi:hypothetical protein